jgi:hypothetical protein
MRGSLKENTKKGCHKFPSGHNTLRFPLILLRLPVPVAERSEARNVFDRSNIGITVSNPTRGMDVCPRFSVLCCPV